MSTETLLIDSALRNWQAAIGRADKLFGGLSEEQLSQEIAPGKNRLLYLWGHLTAVNDALLPLLGLGPRLYPELDAMFLQNADRAVETIGAAELKQRWTEINAALGKGFAALSPDEWVQKHSTVSEADFAREPHRNRFNVLLGRTGHLTYHLGQAVLAGRG